MRTHRCRFACFTIAQWEKEAAWLRQQHHKRGGSSPTSPPGSSYHFAACPPEDVVYHLSTRTRRTWRRSPSSPSAAGGWAYVTGSPSTSTSASPPRTSPRRRPPSSRTPAAQLGMVRRVFWGAMFPLFPLVGGVFLPQFVPSLLPVGPHRGPPFAPGAGGLWGRLSPVRPAVSPAAPGGLAQPASPANRRRGTRSEKQGYCIIASPAQRRGGGYFHGALPLLA